MKLPTGGGNQSAWQNKGCMERANGKHRKSFIGPRLGGFKGCLVIGFPYCQPFIGMVRDVFGNENRTQISPISLEVGEGINGFKGLSQKFVPRILIIAGVRCFA
jgi:hypothetical protein